MEVQRPALSVGEMVPWAGILDRIKRKLDVSICLSLLEDTVTSYLQLPPN